MKVLENHSFTRSAAATSGTYDWDTLLDGQIYQLTKGSGEDADYDCKGSNFRTMAKNACKRRNEGKPEAEHIGVRTQILRTDKEETGLIIQAVPASTLPKREVSEEAKAKAAKARAAKKAAKAKAAKQTANA